MVERDDVSNTIAIRCDLCGTTAPPAIEIAKAHGLVRMGWHCTGGTHICPAHAAQFPKGEQA